MTARRPPDSPPPADLRSAQDAAVDALGGTWFDVGLPHDYKVTL